VQRTLRIGSWRLWVSLRRVQDVKGICSETKAGWHILMWDFDDVPLRAVRLSLDIVQHRYYLSNIYILESKPGKNYMAYCFTEFPWALALKIVIDTPRVDWNYVRLSVIRGYFTLRISPRYGTSPTLVHTLMSEHQETCVIDDLVRAVNYETSKR